MSRIPTEIKSSVTEPDRRYYNDDRPALPKLRLSDTRNRGKALRGKKRKV